MLPYYSYFFNNKAASFTLDLIKTVKFYGEISHAA
jgi:hypothetical protein